jgi:DUF1680 family protein
MFLLHGDSKYMDVLERSLYNGILSGLSLDGQLFFYPNTLRHDGESTFNQGVNGRSPWFNCSCCPSNLSRLVPSVAGYAYASRGSDIYVNLFMNSEVSLHIEGGELLINQQSQYPWEGTIQLDFMNEKAVEADLHIRIPGWLGNKPVPSDLFRFADQQESQPLLRVNGVAVEIKLEKGYAVLQGEWKKGDRITLELPMEDRVIVAHENVSAKAGLLAVQFGPLVYCAEQIDNTNDVLEAGISADSRFDAQFKPGLLGGVNMLKGEEINLIPYYAWANREVGKMNVWFNHIN